MFLTANNQANNSTCIELLSFDVIESISINAIEVADQSLNFVEVYRSFFISNISELVHVFTTVLSFVFEFHTNIFKKLFPYQFLCRAPFLKYICSSSLLHDLFCFPTIQNILRCSDNNK